MYCTKCGIQVPENAYECPNCGAPIINQPETIAQIPQPKLTKKQFLNTPGAKNEKSLITAAAICGYVCAGATLLLMVIIYGQIFSVLDVCLILGFSLGMHIGKSKVCAILLLVYAGINTIVGLLVFHQLSGWLIIAAGVLGVVGFCKLDKAYRAYLEGKTTIGF